ncbi:hypothetical protein [Moorena bouillonii]|uniref:Uncharacterized protein n=1 Tax=Moorena bouillonii PNG TaxID=568701 RepID=A0A1U7N0Q7_9CYAN|nr:hypothetical protein [Moorena bouillonii]OLT59545.1 hypothetical protein BJP37_11385 [Moorena bouillonii PNG]
MDTTADLHHFFDTNAIPFAIDLGQKATLREWSRGARSHGAAAAKSGNDHALPITRCSAVAQAEDTGSGVLYLTVFSLQALEY